MPRSPKAPFIILGLLASIVIVVGGLYLAYQRNVFPALNKLVYKQTNKSRPADSDNLMVSQAVLRWLDTAFMYQGIYGHAMVCASGSNCRINQRNDRSGLAAAWARYKYFQKTNDTEQKQKLLVDARNLADRSKVETLQPDYWSCKLMYEMWQEASFTDEEKNLFKEVCLRALYYVPEENQMKSLISSNSVNLDAMFQEVTAETVKADFPLRPDMDYQYAAHASDKLAEFKFTSDNLDRQLGLFWFKRAAATYFETKNNNTSSNFSPMIGISAVDVWRETNDQSFMDFAQEIYTENQKSYACLSFERCTFQIMLCQELYEATSNKEYKDCANSLMRDIKYLSFDHPDYANALNIGAFFNFAETGSRAYYTHLNSYLAGTLAELE